MKVAIFVIFVFFYLWIKVNKSNYRNFTKMISTKLYYYITIYSTVNKVLPFTCFIYLFLIVIL